MHAKLTLFQNANAMARHAADRMALTARNIANADTPDFQPQHLGAFDAEAPQGLALHRTRSTHVSSATGRSYPITPSKDELAPNGNGVSLELETVAALEAKREHEQALALYRHGLTQLRNAL